mgnify:FL=1
MTSRAVTETLAQQVRELAAERGYTAETLAQASGLTRARLQPILNGEQWPCPRTISALARALEVTIDQLIPQEAR